MNESGTLRTSSDIFLHVDRFWFCSLVALYGFMWLLFHKTSYFRESVVLTGISGSTVMMAHTGHEKVLEGVKCFSAFTVLGWNKGTIEIK